MHRNTYLLIVVLAIIAALVVGINLGKKFQKTDTTIVPTVTVIPTEPSVEVTPEIAGASGIPKTSSVPNTIVTNTPCGFSFSYPANNFSILDDKAGSMQLTNKTNKEDVIIMTCQAEIPRPALPQDKIEKMTISGMSVNLYHDSSEKDGSKLDAIIFTHPTKKTDVFISGYGSSFNALISTVSILK